VSETFVSVLRVIKKKLASDEMEGTREAYLAELRPLQSSRGDSTPFPVSSDPDIRVDLVGRDDLRVGAMRYQHHQPSNCHQPEPGVDSRDIAGYDP
jgi:hypothetical protein